MARWLQTVAGYSSWVQLAGGDCELVQTDCAAIHSPRITTMHHKKPDCLGSYDFEHIAFYARKRFIEGCDTVALIAEAKTERAKEEIALVSMLDVKDEEIRDIELSCRYASQCKIADCRDRLRKMIKEQLSTQHTDFPL